MKTITKKVFFALFALLLANGVFADGNDPIKETSKIMTVSGKVIDETTGETLAGVKITVPGTDKVAYTDFDGEFKIECDLSKGDQVSVSMISYDSKIFKATDSGNKKINLKRQK